MHIAMGRRAKNQSARMDHKTCNEKSKVKKIRFDLGAIFMQAIRELMSDNLYALLISLVMSAILGFTLPFIKKTFIFMINYKRKSPICEARHFYYVWKAGDNVTIYYMKVRIKKELCLNIDCIFMMMNWISITMAADI